MCRQSVVVISIASPLSNALTSFSSSFPAERAVASSRPKVSMYAVRARLRSAIAFGFAFAVGGDARHAGGEAAMFLVRDQFNFEGGHGLRLRPAGCIIACPL